MPQLRKLTSILLIIIAVAVLGVIAVGAASNSLSFKAGKLPPANAGVPYLNGVGFSFCNPAPAQVSDLCPPGYPFTSPKSPKGGNPPYHFQLQGGFPPLGMTLDLNGRLHGTPNITDHGPTTFTVCAIDLSANQVCVPVTINVFNLDGNYTGSYKGVANVTVIATGAPRRQSVSGGISGSIDQGAITVIDPGAGSGTVTPLGDAAFSSGGVGVFGADCSFAGSFVTSKVGAVKAAGTFSCTIDTPDVTGEATGTWTAKKVL